MSAGRIDDATYETCDECGFNGEEWVDAEALSALLQLPDRFVGAIEGLTVEELLRRPVTSRWSIAEYVDHVREVLFGMRFLVDLVVTQPGIDLGEAPSSTFQAEPRRIDVVAALAGIKNEAVLLLESLAQLPVGAWRRTVTLDGTEIDPGWIARHALHDSTHHILDIEQLRLAL
jgi:hypothetical protein